MKTLWKPFRPVAMSHWIRNLRKNFLWIAGGGASTALILISCATSGHTMMAPPSIPGATFVGSEECAQCHENIVRDFKTADHARLQAKGPNAVNMGCESCHGPGSKHVEAGGGAGTIINPNKSPETCFQCHLDKKAQFSMPFAHPVLEGKMSCSDCHNPHKGSAMKGGGTQLASMNETCIAVPHPAARPVRLPARRRPRGLRLLPQPARFREPEDAHRAQCEPVPEVPLPGPARCRHRQTEHRWPQSRQFPRPRHLLDCGLSRRCPRFECERPPPPLIKLNILNHMKRKYFNGKAGLATTIRMGCAAAICMIPAQVFAGATEAPAAPAPVEEIEPATNWIDLTVGGASSVATRGL